MVCTVSVAHLLNKIVACSVLLLIIGQKVHAAQYEVLKNTTIVNCKGQVNILELPDPYPDATSDNDFMSLEWKFSSENGTQQVIYQENFAGDKTFNDEKFENFGRAGLRLNNPTLNDVGLYSAVMVTRTSQGIKNFHFYIAEPPVLKSKTLSVTRKEDNDKITLSCGDFTSLGYPTIDIYWKAPNGSKLSGSYKDGVLLLVIDKEEGQGRYTCEIDQEDSPAMKCIPESALDKWVGGSIDFITKNSNTTNFAIIIGSVIASLVGLIVIVILSYLLCKRCKQGDAYNTVLPTS